MGFKKKKPGCQSKCSKETLPTSNNTIKLMFCGKGTVEKSLEIAFDVHCHLQKQESLYFSAFLAFMSS